ncbi:MAG: sigma-54 dependent transcriptional regulator [Candidatus Thiodiazotropha sp. (ex Ctena orbiculata)]|uniref:Sigma-54 dependent transcriptional regulator n=1 Tax=Candidatus Thiodiazotropha taylori TaxID=2792791 RepID=A0A944MCI2_9GAMM|nr:sigma-54 dependent transcriptional regulator [Candidatus Thiodiazotropha taylori]MBT3028795.1 sigma-54 dependent transcriptional regulator [Candidatus Thiodiazotropha taylori]MBT3036822.1 sigma-54 dependent transcriptional regulator [Candidatus Thiodiazotropha taylori]PUB88270.1 MAG: DNA-binding response regulator [gamma proteobacterium symbiont of Ctena orbiculata]
MNTNPDVYFIDDEIDLRIANEQTLELAGFQVKVFEKAEEVLKLVSDQTSGIVVSDIRLPGIDGLALLQRLQQMDATLPIILITGHGDISMAVDAMQKGAYDFIEKPFSAERLVDTVRRALEKRRLILENRTLKSELDAENTLGPRIIGKTPAIKTLKKTINQLADTAADILLLGETGTGKELMARSLHEHSQRRDKNFVAVNCGAIPENLIESELFGHEKGAFTGAQALRIGKFEYANHGTVFLDEVESMPLPAQVRLLRVLQERSLERIGSNESIELDIRIIAATKVDLKTAAERGEFREDLYYRLNVVTLDLPPLRERREDIPLLFQHFLLVAAARYGKVAPAMPDNINQKLMAFNWPGNVRELRNVAERFVLLGDECGLQLDENSTISPCIPMTLPEHVEAFERAMIEQALSESGGVIKKTMDLLGLPRKTLYDKMQKYGLDKRLYK